MSVFFQQAHGFVIQRLISDTVRQTTVDTAELVGGFFWWDWLLRMLLLCKVTVWLLLLLCVVESGLLLHMTETGLLVWLCVVEASLWLRMT